MNALAELFVDGHWLRIRDADARGMALFRRHYSFREYRDNRPRTKWIGPGEYLALLTADCLAVFAWRRMKFPDLAGQAGVCCALFRNEGPVRSSDLIREACDLAWLRWPGERLFTYVNPRAVQSPNAGYCFKAAGWRLCRDATGRPRETKVNRLLILEVTA